METDIPPQEEAPEEPQDVIVQVTGVIAYLSEET
jgi:hypothetical protein